MTEEVTPLAGLEYFPIESCVVGEFHESNDGSGDPVAVMLMLKIEGASDTPFVMRLNSRAAADALIAALTEHSNAVWPDEG